MVLNGTDLKDATLTDTYDYIRNNPRHLYQRAQDIINSKLGIQQPQMQPQQPMVGLNTAGGTTSSWNQLENK
jgi:hypothetical protein